jgi:hypothetical protein
MNIDTDKLLWKGWLNDHGYVRYVYEGEVDYLISHGGLFLLQIEEGRCTQVEDLCDNKRDALVRAINSCQQRLEQLHEYSEHSPAAVAFKEKTAARKKRLEQELADEEATP